MLQKSRACFFWGRRSAAGSSDTDAQGWETWHRSQMYVSSRRSQHVFQKCRLFNMSKLKSWNVPGSSFRISKNPDVEKVGNRKFTPENHFQKYEVAFWIDSGLCTPGPGVWKTLGNYKRWIWQVSGGPPSALLLRVYIRVRWYPPNGIFRHV